MRPSYLSARRIPLALCYHAVSERLGSELAVTPGQLRRQMAALAEAGYRSVTFTELERLRAGGHDTTAVVAVTFDDGYASMLTAREILDEVGFVGTVFVLPPAVGSGRPLRWRGIERLADGPHGAELLPLDWDGVRTLHSGGWEIGSHTLTHPHLTDVNDEQLAAELGDSRAALGERLGECTSLAYPYGAANARVAAAAAAAGYECATTLTRWHRRDTPHRRPRVGIYLGDDERRFAVKIAPWSRTARALAVSSAV